MTSSKGGEKRFKKKKKTKKTPMNWGKKGMRKNPLFIKRTVGGGVGVVDVEKKSSSAEKSLFKKVPTALKDPTGMSTKDRGKVRELTEKKGTFEDQVLGWGRSGE